MQRTVVATVTVAAVLAALTVAGGPIGGVAAQEPVDCSFPVTVTDATGAEVTVPERPARVVVLGPSAAQQVWAIGAQDRVVGMPVNEYTAYLEGRDAIEDVVGADGQPVQETVVGLEPDLVLAPNIIQNETVGSLRNAGLTVYRYDQARSLAAVADEIETTGRLLGSVESAARVSAEMQGTVAAIRTAVADEPRPRVYYPLGGGWTAGTDTFISDLIQTAGGQNIDVQAGIERYATISPEVVAERDPEALLVHENASVPTGAAINNSTAVREGNVVRLNPNFLNQPGPRNVVPLERLARALHPAAMANASLEDAATPTPATCAEPNTTTATATDSTTADTATTPGATGDGFTVAIAILAVALGLLARRRRA
jgi:iron complex transport system substrate-binding protein